MEGMFCYQCEQTAAHKGCTGKAGVCGKSAEVARLQDRLTGLLVKLAVASEGHVSSTGTTRLFLEGLFTTLTNVNFDVSAMREKIAEARAGLAAFPEPCAACHGACEDGYDMARLWGEPDEDVRSLKSLLLFGMRGMAAYAWHALVLGLSDDGVNAFFPKGLRAIAKENDKEKLLALVMELGQVNLACMELLDRANTEACGAPVPTEVSLTVEKGPFIVVSGHDLHDLEKLLEQTEGKGINVYTHGEMLPAHAYPKLKAHAHLKGHFGTAWQNQQKEFAGLPAPVLFTTNCIMPVRAGYADRVFTTGVVHYPGAAHIDDDKDFTPVIETALRLGGFAEDTPMTGTNGGTRLLTGFGHKATLASAGAIVEAVKTKAIRHFFLVGGCDGARPGRDYYTEFVRMTPKDSVILTLACGKFRFNDMDLGTVGGLPRLLDMGQCNDAYSAIKVASALAEAFGCGVNDLPLTLVLSWYEQKAVCILLTLLSLGLRNIYLGPTLPAFVSPNILKFLVERFDIHPIGNSEEDLHNMLG